MKRHLTVFGERVKF